MHSITTIPEDISKTLCELIEHYIDRQKIVVQAMIQFRPDLIRGFGIDKLLQISVEEQYEYFLQHYLGNDDIFHGFWNEEWEYLLHGHGCKLLNVNSGEPLEWDAGHPDAFYLGWFGNHLAWRIEHDPDNDSLKNYLAWSRQSKSKLQDVLNYLIEKQILIQKENIPGWFLASK